MLSPSEIIITWEILRNISAGNEDIISRMDNVRFLHSKEYFFSSLRSYGFEIGLPPFDFLNHATLQGIASREMVSISAILPIWDLNGNKTDVTVDIEINRSNSSFFIIRGHDIL